VRAVGLGAGRARGAPRAATRRAALVLAGLACPMRCLLETVSLNPSMVCLPIRLQRQRKYLVKKLCCSVQMAGVSRRCMLFLQP